MEMASVYIEEYLPAVLAELVDAYQRSSKLFAWTYGMDPRRVNVYQYDIDTQTWETLYAKVKLGHVLNAYGMQLLFRSEDGPSVWNAYLNQVTELPSVNRSHYRLNLLNGKVYICGGEDLRGKNIITTVQVCTAGEWDPVTSLQKLDLIATAGGDSLYVITTDMVTKRSIERFNVNTDTWSVLPDLDMQFWRQPNITVVDDTLYVLIQKKRTSPNLTLLCYDEEDNEWIEVSTLDNVTMVDHMAGSNNKLFICGRDDQNTSVIVMYDFDTEEWVNIPLPDLSRMEKVFDISTV